MLGAVHQRLGELEAKRLAQCLPPLPHALQAILRELDSEDASTASVAKIVESDPVLAGRILRMARSGFYSRGREVRRVDEAVARLGLRTTRNLALAASVRQLKAPETLIYGQRGFFMHCFTVAQVATKLARKYRFDSDVVFLAGLMHDVGLFVGEGYDHAEIGRIVARYWKLPEEVCTIIGSHHDVEASPVIQTVRIADLAADATGVGLSEPALVEVDHPWFDEALGYVPDALEQATNAYSALQ